MRPNGRRRWRKARAPRGKGRVFYGPDTKLGDEAKAKTDAQVVLIDRAADWMRRHRFSMHTADGKRAANWFPESLPAKPFAATSLCGMTMGARKRWARNDTALKPEYRGETVSSERRRSNLFMWQIMHKKEPGSFLYADTRAFYRIGERLRPCPGCVRCVRLTADDIDGSPDQSFLSICDGSGVLPAKGKR